MGRTEKVGKMEVAFNEKSSNQDVIKAVVNIPKENSLVFLTNSSVEGFIAGRSDIWKFPDYYDVADFLLIQRNAKQSFFSFSVDERQNLSEALLGGKNAMADDALISEDMTKAIIRDLVVEKTTHRIVADESHLLILERIDKSLIFNPASTTNFGWIKALRK